MLPVRQAQENCANTGKERGGDVWRTQVKYFRVQNGTEGAVKKCGSEAKDKNRFLVTEVLQLSNWIRSSPFIFFVFLCAPALGRFLQLTTA